jgi:hypothetical protein
VKTRSGPPALSAIRYLQVGALRGPRRHSDLEFRPPIGVGRVPGAPNSPESRERKSTGLAATRDVCVGDAQRAWPVNQSLGRRRYQHGRQALGSAPYLWRRILLLSPAIMRPGPGSNVHLNAETAAHERISPGWFQLLLHPRGNACFRKESRATLGPRLLYTCIRSKIHH